MANYTYDIGTDTKPITVNVKPGDTESTKSLEVFGEQFAGQVFIESESTPDVYVKAKVLAVNADGLEEYTYKKYDTYAQRITIKVANEVVVNTSNTAEAGGDNAGKFAKTTTTYTLVNGVLTPGTPEVEYVEEQGSGEDVVTSITYKEFTAAYNGTEWVDDNGAATEETTPNTSYKTVTYVSEYSFDTGSYGTPGSPNAVGVADADTAIAAQTAGPSYKVFTTTNGVTDDGTAFTDTEQNPYAYVSNNIVGEKILFAIKNPTNIDTREVAGTEYNVVNPAEVSLSVYGCYGMPNATVPEITPNVLATEFNARATVSQDNAFFMGFANNDTAASYTTDDSFELGEGVNTITFDTKLTKTVNNNEVVAGFGNDVVTMTPGEKLDLQFTNGGEIVALQDGDDVVFSTVQYVAVAKVYGGTGWCTDEGGFGADAAHATTYEFELAPYHDTQFNNPAYEGKILWKAVEGYNYGNNIRYVSLEASDFYSYNAETGTCSANNSGELTDPQITDIKVYRIVNGTQEDYTKQYFDAADESGDTATSDLYDKHRVAGTVTVKDLWSTNVPGEGFLGGENVGLTVNGDDWATYCPTYDKVEHKFVVTPDKDGNYVGTYKDEYAASTVNNEVFNLEKGADKVEFRGYFGNDTVKATQRESLDLVIKNVGGEEISIPKPGTTNPILVASTSGDDVILSAQVEYYAKATVSGSAYGHNFGTGENATEYTFKLRGAHLSSATAMADSWGVVDEGDILWYATESYGKNNDNVDTYLALDITDFATETNQVKDAHDNITSYKTKFGGTADVTDIKIYKIVNGVETEITGSYLDNYTGLNNAADDSLARSLYESQINGSITLEGFAGKDVTKANVYINDYHAFMYSSNTMLNFSPTPDTTGALVGSKFGEKVNSTAADETYDLKTGRDTVYLQGTYGNDTVKLTKGEKFQMFIKNNGGNVVEDYVTEMKGNDLVVTSKISYYATATVSGSAYGHDFGTGENATEYTFKLRGAHLSSATAMADSWGVVDEGDILWYATESYGKNNDNVDTYLALDITDFATTANQTKDDDGKITSYHTTFGGANAATVSGIKIYKVVNGEETEITSSYLTGYTGENVATDDSLAKSLYKSQVDGTVTVKDFNSKGSDTIFMINNDEFKNELVSKNNVFTGSTADEVAYSTEKDETFNLKTGKDKIVFRGNIGNDTVKITNGEVLDLDFAGQDVVFETKGNDVVASVDVSYYATATVTGTAYGHNFGAGTEASPATEYTFTLRGSHLSSPEAMAESVNKTDEGDILWYADKPYGQNSDGADTYLALDITDFGTTHEDHDDATDPTAVTSYHTKFGNVTSFADVTNIRIFKVVNGETYEITDGYAFGHATADPKDDSCARALYETQVSGSVTLKDFNKSDIDAKVTLNGSEDDIRETYAYEAANTYNDPSDFKGGKITTKSSADIINAAGYVSPNGKGLTINSGSGNDFIVGSDYNDKVTVKSLAGDKTETYEYSGTNKITTGKGDDKVVIGADPTLVNTPDYVTNNTVKLGAGDNTAIVNAYGKNNITGGSGNDKFELYKGFNTVNAKNGENSFEVTNGNNKLTGGKDVDTFTLVGGQNTVKAGKGNDFVEITGGYNTITLGAGDDKVVAFDGYNTIKGTKGNNKYEINGGSNVITGGSGVDEFVFNTDEDIAAFSDGVNAIINGGKGNDIYDLTDANYGIDTINITDTKGKNVVKLAEKDTILFDVTLGKKAKKDKVSNLLTFRNDDGDVSYKGKIAKVTVADDNGDGLADPTSTDYTLNIKGVAEQVASFMREELRLGKGASAYDVLAKGGENAEKLLAIYEGNGVNIGGTDKYVADIYKA